MTLIYSVIWGGQTTKKIFINDRKEREQRATEEAERKKIEENKEKEKEIQGPLIALR